MSAPSGCYIQTYGGSNYNFYFYNSDSQTYGFDIYDGQSGNGGWHGCSNTAVGTTTSNTLNFGNYTDLSTIQGRCRDINNNWTYSNSISNPAYAPPAPSQPNITLGTVTATSAVVNYTTFATTSYIIVSAYRTVDGVTESSNTVYSGVGSLSYNVSINASTHYQIRIVAYNSSGAASSMASTVQFTSPGGAVFPEQATNLSISAPTNSSIRVSYTVGANSVRTKVELYTVEGYLVTILEGSTTGSTFVTFTGLTPGTQYHANVVGYSITDNITTSGALYITLGAARPALFGGFTTIVANGNFYQTTVNADRSINAYVMPASEWNSFTANINLVRTYKNFYTSSLTQVTRDTIFTKAMINDAINAINDMVYTGLAFNPDTITASLFQTLKTKLNSIT